MAQCLDFPRLTQMGYGRWAISWTNQFAWPSGLISSDAFGSGAAAPGKLPGKLQYLRPADIADGVHM